MSIHGSGTAGFLLWGSLKGNLPETGRELVRVHDQTLVLCDSGNKCGRRGNGIAGDDQFL